MNPPVEKPWGTTQLILTQGNVSCHRLVINAGGASSWHYHQHKHNMIIVEAGALMIGLASQEILLKPGDGLTLTPGQRHGFRALEETVAFEFYWQVLDENDIIRVSPHEVTKVNYHG